MSAVALLAAVLAVLSGYSLLLLAVCAPKAYRNGYCAGVREAEARRFYVVPDDL